MGGLSMLLLAGEHALTAQEVRSSLCLPAASPQFRLLWRRVFDQWEMKFNTHLGLTSGWTEVWALWYKSCIPAVNVEVGPGFSICSILILLTEYLITPGRSAPWDRSQVERLKYSNCVNKQEIHKLFWARISYACAVPHTTVSLALMQNKYLIIYVPSVSL